MFRSTFWGGGVNPFECVEATVLHIAHAVIAVLDDDSDDPPFEHDAPSAPCCSGNKRSFPLCWTEEQTNATSAALDLADKIIERRDVRGAAVSLAAPRTSTQRKYNQNSWGAAAAAAGGVRHQHSQSGAM